MPINFAPLFGSLDRVSGVTGIYTPLGGTAVDVRVTPGRTAQDSTPNRMVRSNKRAQDWLLSLAEYPDEPQVGDQLRVFYADRETVFEVRAEGQSLAWEWSDRDKQRRRIHTVEIVAEG